MGLDSISSSSSASSCATAIGLVSGPLPFGIPISTSIP